MEKKLVVAFSEEDNRILEDAAKITKRPMMVLIRMALNEQFLRIQEEAEKEGKLVFEFPVDLDWEENNFIRKMSIPVSEPVYDIYRRYIKPQPFVQQKFLVYLIMPIFQQIIEKKKTSLEVSLL